MPADRQPGKHEAGVAHGIHRLRHPAVAGRLAEAGADVRAEPAAGGGEDQCAGGEEGPGERDYYHAHRLGRALRS